MTWQAKATLTALVAMIDAIPGVQSVSKGEPLSLGAAVSAYVALGAAPVSDRSTTSLLTRTVDYWITFGYRVQGAPAGIEDTLCDVLDDFERGFYVERKSGALAGTAESMELDTTPASSPDYRPIAGQEFRLYPVLVRVKQSHTIP